ncbi:sensor histidine kinase [Ancylobacter oerskovii]|uniref:Sensor histidine kinase n=1 Tax=Ancylobacter oerskovii TaxID=459519 RepID=A0ABW4Z543_9HYPH|nr:histidine kinase [Ancylobacter oerskovii]
MPSASRSVKAALSDCRPIPWRVLWVGWGLLAVIDIVDRLLTFESVIAALVLTAGTYPAATLLAAGLGRIYDRIFVDTRLTLFKIAVTVGLCVVAGIAIVTTMTAIRVAMGWNMLGAYQLEEFVIPAGHYSMAFLAWSVLYFWMVTEAGRQREQQRAAQSQMEALHAEIHELQLQLDPHFLINALNGIAEETHDSPDRAVAMIVDLTTYLRHVLAGLRTPVMSVRSEIEGLGAYLRLQQARFADRVRVHLSVDPAAADWPVANLLFQPLVENAFEHGDRAVKLEVSIRVSLDGEGLRIEIENTGHLVSTVKARPGHGLGLENIRRRLDVHYPGRHQFVLRQMEDEGGARVSALLRLEGEPCSVS